MRNIYLAIVLLLAALSLPGCRKADKTSLYTIGFSQCVGSDLWRRTMLEEMRTELSLHPGVKFIYTDAGGDSQKQIRQVKTMVSQGIDLLIISPNEAKPLTGIVEQTYSKGIPVIVIDRKTSSDAYTAYVGADNYQIGKLAGEYLGPLLKNKGNVLEVMGLPGSSPAIERDKGFTDAIKKFSGIHITDQVYGDWLKDHAENQLERIKSRLKNINAVFAHNDVMASGARQIVNGIGLKNSVKVIGVDALPGEGGGLQMISEKVIDASVLYPTGGKEAITTAFKILNKEVFQKENLLQTLVIDSGNAQLMKLQWNRISSQQNDIVRQQSLIAEQEQIYNSQQVVLNIIVITLVLAIVFGGLAFYWLTENRKINKSLEAKNLEILEQRNRLIEMSARAEVATEAKLNFFTNISHEFRTPLTLILSPVEDMMRNERLNMIAGKSLKLMHKNVFRLLRLVNQLIDYRKIEYEKQPLNASENDLVEFVREILNSFQATAQQRTLRLQVSQPRIMAWFDVNLLDKVFFNLFSNSFKFTPATGTIAVTIEQTGEHIQVIVEDNGIGMEAEEAAHVFEPFYQAGDLSLKGSGLGLSLSREIIHLHQGTINVSSKKWQGTAFTIVLKAGNAQSQLPPAPAQVKPTDFSYKAALYTCDFMEEPAEASTGFAERPHEQSILLVEDNGDLLHYLSEKMNEHYEVYVAFNGTDAIRMAYEQVPDLIISDVMLPGISGKDIAERLKTDLRTSHIPIILLTAQNGIEQQIDGIRSMADAYITKPFHYDYLMATVENLIKNRVLLKEHFTSDFTPAGRVNISKSLDKKFLNDFSGIVEQNLANENFSVDNICKAIGISRVQLYRKVKALLDCTITDYIVNRRLMKARYLLSNEDHTIADITYMVGFSSPNYFSTLFKNKYGCAPSEFKKGIRADKS